MTATVPHSLLDACERPGAVDYDGLRGMTETDREKYWTSRDASWEGHMNDCQARGDAALAIIGDANHAAAEAAPPKPHHWWQP